MTPSVLFCPVLAGFIALSPTVVPNETTDLSATVVVSNNEDPAVPAEGDQLERLRGHLRMLSDTLGETQKAVESVARQRDEARTEVARGQEQLSQAMKELDGLTNKLGAARAEAKQWQEKAQVAEMTHADLQKFRGDLQGAIAEFENLKNDFSAARTELRDPIERAEMKKAMAGVKKEHAHLKHEIEVALKARAESMAETVKVQEEWEKSMRQASQLKSALEKEQKARSGFEARLAEAVALNGSNLAKLKDSQKRVSAADKNVIRLKSEKDVVARSLAALEERGVVTAEMQAQKEAVEGRFAALTSKLAVAERESASWQGRSEELAARLKERDAELSKVRSTLKEREVAMAAIPQVDERIVAEFEKTKGELVRVKGELSFLQKSKSRMEQKLVKQSSEIRELKGQLRKVEGKPLDGKIEAQPEQDKALGAYPIPRAIVVHEG